MPRGRPRCIRRSTHELRTNQKLDVIIDRLNNLLQNRRSKNSDTVAQRIVDVAEEVLQLMREDATPVRLHEQMRQSNAAYREFERGDEEARSVEDSARRFGQEMGDRFLQTVTRRTQDCRPSLRKV